MTKRKTSEDRKSEILSATLGLAFEVGPDHVTTGMIAARLGLTQPAIYKHFPKKEDIWREATETLCKQIRENIQLGLQSPASPLDNLRLLVLGHLHLIAKTPALPEIMVTRDPTNIMADTRHAVQAEIAAFRKLLTRTIEKAQLDGQLRAGLSAEDAGTLLFGIIQSLVLRLIVSHDASALFQDGERLLDLQLALFADEGIAT